jgi:hypothetical protein
MTEEKLKLNGEMRTYPDTGHSLTVFGEVEAQYSAT